MSRKLFHNEISGELRRVRKLLNLSGMAVITLVSSTLWSGGVFANASESNSLPLDLQKYCVDGLAKFPGKFDKKMIAQACAKIERSKSCTSAEGRPIYHYNKNGDEAKAKKILVFSLIHGDETEAGTVGRYWMQRLESISPRNNWRVVPVLNPDGVLRKTRTNANKIDLNRNFPTADWNELATKYWVDSMKSNPRRFPGKEAGSEPEVQCALEHIESYQPDFIVSVHTPLRVLDYDGPKISRPPKFDYLPWKTLGHMPGSLGRYMWFERQTPVLTMELKEDLPVSFAPFEQLQDIIGMLVQMDEKPTAPSEKKIPGITAQNGDPEEVNK